MTTATAQQRAEQSCSTVYNYIVFVSIIIALQYYHGVLLHVCNYIDRIFAKEQHLNHMNTNYNSHNYIVGNYKHTCIYIHVHVHNYTKKKVQDKEEWH